MKRFRSRAVLALAGTVLATGTGVGVAHAFFGGAGSGTGHGSTGTLATVTVAAVSGSPTTPLLPGGSGDVVLTLDNPNAFAVTLVSVTGNGAITPDSNHSSGCTTTGVSFMNQAGLNISVPSGTSTVHLAGAALMSASSSNGCQGATFSIPVAITVHE